ncbi:MAG: hypothetical protein MUC67_01155 [Acidobacteria bacterium]|jgi:hypothetical protein|nr:hypothetical protein [Acidobacteriota bacterium]MCU0254019.1 hypothetical protein [Acidobacteriota bacterium]
MTMRIPVSLLTLLALAALPAVAEAAAPTVAENIQLTIGVATERDGKVEQSRTFTLICRDGERSDLTVGNRIPIPATTVDASAEKGSAPITSYAYQHVGFVAGLRCKREQDGRIAVEGSYEDSSLRPPGPGAPDQPIITTFNQKIDVVLRPGKPLTVARFSDAKGFSTTLTIEAKPLD